MAIATQPINLRTQTIGGRKVTMVDLGGFLGFQVSGLGTVPAGIASVAAGKDRWMRSLQVKCPGCGAVVPVDQTDDNQSCEDCQWVSPDECRE